MTNYSHISLTWHSNPHGKTEMLMNLFNSNKLTDVTLVCDDGKWFEVHKAVVSIFSPVLKSILIETEQIDPIINITDIYSTDLKVILELMYSGEAQMHKCEEKSFYQAIKFLEIQKPLLKKTCNQIQKPLLEKTCNEEDELLTDKDQPAASKSLNDSNMKTKIDTVEVKNIIQLPNIQIDNKSKIHACLRCNHKATTFASLKVHVENIHENKKYKCSQCNKEYRQSSGLSEHIRTAHEGKRFKCDKCSYESVSHHNLKNHKLNKHEGVKFKCDLCSKYLSSKDLLAGHTQRIHQLGKYSCNFCTKEFRLDSMLTDHMKSHGILKSLRYEN